MNVVVITGASSGMGRVFAEKLDRAFLGIDQFWLIARREEPLNRLSEKLAHDSRVFGMDVTSRESMDKLEKALRQSRATVRILINCAGYGVMGPFAQANRERTLGMIRVNCEALTDLTYRMLPFMKKGSRIIQLASSAAFLPQPDFAVYAASKAYVHSFSRALGEELRQKGIYVTSVCPGPVDTPFFQTAERDGSTLALKKWTMVTPERVVEQALRDSRNRRPVSVCSLPIRAFRGLAKAVPHSLLLRGTTVLKHLEDAVAANNRKG